MGLFGILKKHYGDFEDEDYDYDMYEALDYSKKPLAEADSTSDVKVYAHTQGHYGTNDEPVNKDNVSLDKINESPLTDKAVKDSKRSLHINHKGYDKDEVESYVKNQCDIMEEATRYIDNMMGQYSIITEHFADIELFANAPDNIKNEISAEAECVDSITVDRRIFKAAESKISNSTYHRMEMYEAQLPETLDFISREESNYENIRRDMKILQGEQLALRIEAKNLKKKQMRIKNAATATLVCLVVVFSIFVIAMLSIGDDDSITLFFTVTVLGAILALGMFAILKYTQRNVLVTQARLNRATNLLNKTKLKYVNSANVLSYEYNKFKVKNSYELRKKYEAYLEMKSEQRNIVEMTARLNAAEERLMLLLKKLGMSDCNIWLTQVRALYNNNEMVEIRHNLLTQRQKLREQIEYNEQRIKEVKNNIKDVTQCYPNFAANTLRIIEEYEKKSKDRSVSL